MGWFAAKVRFRAVQAPGARRSLLEDSVIVFRSRSLPLARRRAASLADAMIVERVDVDTAGRKVRWAVDRVLDVAEVGTEGLVDGAEIWRDRWSRGHAAGPGEAAGGAA
jgi:hypothetical protein